MRELDNKGHVPASGAVTKQGTKNTGISLSFDNIARSSLEIKNEEFERIRQATLKKADKSYPKNTALVVMFPDYVLIMKSEDLTELKKFVEKELLPKLKQFKLVAFVGWSGKAYLEYPLER